MNAKEFLNKSNIKDGLISYNYTAYFMEEYLTYKTKTRKPKNWDKYNSRINQ